MFYDKWKLYEIQILVSINIVMQFSTPAIVQKYRPGTHLKSCAPMFSALFITSNMSYYHMINFTVTIVILFRRLIKTLVAPIKQYFNCVMLIFL